MRRLLAAIRIEARLAYRQGLCLAALAAAALAAVAALAAPAQAGTGILPGVLLAYALACGFGFGGYRMLRDRRDGVLATLDMSPLRPHEALAARILVPCALAAAGSVPAALAGHGIRLQALPLALGMGAGTAVAALAGLLAAAWHRPGPGFLVGSAAYILALAAPLLPGVWGSGESAGASAWFRWHPLHGPLTLLQGAFARPELADAALGLSITLLWAGAALALCKRALGTLRERG